jgi:hypothetical protein
MLTVGYKKDRGPSGSGPVFECPKSGYNTAGPWAYTRTAPKRVTPPPPARSPSPGTRSAAKLLARDEVAAHRGEYRQAAGAAAPKALRAGIERDQWSAAIHPAGIEMKGRVIIGSREDAELQAHAIIDDWLKKHSTLKPKSD